MSRIVFAWELGENHGHLWRLLPIARALRERGHTVSFGLKPMALAQRYLAPHGIRAFACPTPLGLAAPGRELGTYTDILMANGAAHPDLLHGMVQAWQNLYEALQADLVVVEHAPFALLAANRAGIPSVHVGTGFTIPPTLSPAPCFRPWEADLVGARAQTQADVERTIQTLFDAPQSLSEALCASHTRLLTLPELDHYAAWRPPGTTFLGPVPEPDAGEAVTWQQPAKPHVFAYLYAQPWLDTLLVALARSGADVIAVVPDASAAQVSRYPNLRLYRRPVQLAPLLAGCSLAVTHAGHGTALNCLLAGVPMLLLPQHIEQLMVTDRVATLGAGVGILPDFVQSRCADVLHDMLHNPRYGDAVRAVAARYREISRDQALRAIVELIEQASAQHC